jgi:hypothetical protein
MTYKSTTSFQQRMATVGQASRMLLGASSAGLLRLNARQVRTPLPRYKIVRSRVFKTLAAMRSWPTNITSINFKRN